MKTQLMIGTIIVASSLGDILISRGMKQVGEIEALDWRHLWRMASRTITNLSVVGGIAAMAVAFFSLLAVLSWAPLSLVSPATALSYVINTVGAKFYLEEKIDTLRWVGTLLVCVGAACLEWK
jgi:drug/metabolite transporter (DMT)-like permease